MNRDLFAKHFMPILGRLNQKEGEDYLGVLLARRSKDAELDRLIRLNDRSEEERLAKLSEKAKYEEKTYQQTSHEKLQYQDKERVKVDEDRLKAAVLNGAEFRQRV